MSNFDKDTKNKKMKRKPNIKTNIAEKVHKYHKIVNVKSQREFNKKHGGLEHGLGKCLEIFFETKLWKLDISIIYSRSCITKVSPL